MILEKRYNTVDLEQVYSQSQGFIEQFRDSHILVAGASGFVGSWLISSVDHMNKFYASNIKITGLAREISPVFASAFPNVNFINADIAKKNLEIDFVPDCIFNAATPSSPAHGGEIPEQVLSAAIQGTQNLIQVCDSSHKATFVNLSSGIVTKRHQDQSLNLTSTKDAYLSGKRESEKLVEEATAEGLILGQNLRLYAFAGPGISLVDHFAVGNFMNDALHSRPISIKGNPNTRRSYLYPTDLAVNILAATTLPESRTIEVGSIHNFSMFELASLINSVTGNEGIDQSPGYGSADAYSPMNNELIVNQQVSLDAAITRWHSWLRKD